MGAGASKNEACLPCLLLRPARQRPGDRADARLDTPAAEDDLFRSILRLQPACVGEACRRREGAPVAAPLLSPQATKRSQQATDVGGRGSAGTSTGSWGDGAARESSPGGAPSDGCSSSLGACTPMHAWAHVGGCTEAAPTGGECAPSFGATRLFASHSTPQPDRPDELASLSFVETPVH